MKKFALIGLIALVVGGIGTMFNWDEISSQNRGNTIEKTVTITNDHIDTIDLKSDVGEVNFYQTTEETIQVDFSDRSDKKVEDLLTIEEIGNTLAITIHQRSRFLNISFFSSWLNRNPILNIGLPESFAGSIEATVDVGSIQVDDLTLDLFDGFVNVGSITGSNLDLNHGHVEIDVGEIDLSGVTGEWYLATDVGEIKLAHLDWQGKIEAHTDIGDILIRMAEEPEYYSLNLDTELGDVKGAADNSIQSRSQPDLPSLKATTDIGDIRLEWGR